MISSTLSRRDDPPSAVVSAIVSGPTPRWASLVLALALSLMVGRGAAAAPVDPEARVLYQEGLQLYRAGRYDDAIAKLDASYQLVAAPGLLYDLAQAHRLKGDCAGALRLYRDFLRDVPGDLPGAAVASPVEALARSHVVQMESCVAARARDSDSSTIPPSAIAATAASGSPARPPLSLAATAPAVGVGAGTNLIARAPPRLARRRAALTLGLASLALAAATGYFGWQADRASDQVSRLYVPGQAWNAAGMDAQETGYTSAKLELATAVGAILSGAMALWLAVRD